MRKSRRIVAVIAAMLMALSALSCFAFAAPATLPEGYVVVNTEWAGKEQLEHFTFELGGDTYELEYGSTAAASIDEALSLPTAANKHRTVVLAPGVYSAEMKITSNISLCGPYFGKNPNNSPYSSQYNSSLEDWTVNNDRSLDETKEAVLTGKINFVDGCTDVVIDGIAMTGSAQIMDSGRSNTKTKVYYTLKNIFAKNATSNNVFFFDNSKGLVNRHIVFENCRMDSIGSGEQSVRYRAETFTMTGSYFGNTSSVRQFYCYTNQPGDVIGGDDTIRNSFYNNRFENIGGNGIINFAARDSVNSNISKRSRVVLEVINNDFINCCPSGTTSASYVIRPQGAGSNQWFICTNNRFIIRDGYNTAASSIAIYPYNDVDNICRYAKLDISKNYFYNYSEPIKTSSSATKGNVFNNIGPNYWDDMKGGQKSWSSTNANCTYALGSVYDKDCLYSSADFNLLNSNLGTVSFSGNGESRSATLYYVTSGVPTFRFKGEAVSYKVYSDSACTQEITGSVTPANNDKIYVMASEGSYTCKYTITFSSAAANKTDVFKYGDADVAGNNVLDLRLFIDATKSTSGYYTFPTDKAVELSTGATAAVYTNEECTGNPITSMKLENTVNKAYLKVVAPNGSESSIWTIYIYGCDAQGDDTPQGGSSECELLKLTVPGATVSGSSESGYDVTVANGVKSISPKLIVSGKAVYAFYLDKECKYAAATTNTVQLAAKDNVFYIRVTAEDGTKSAPIKVTVHSNRKAASYSDMNKVPSYAKKAVNYLSQNGYGIFSGDEKNRLNPSNNITRYELAKVVVSLAGINVEMAKSVDLGNTFDDFDKIQVEAPWAIPYIRAAYATGLLQGNSDGKGNLLFDGNAGTTREQFVTVMVRMMTDQMGVSVSQYYKAHKADIEKAYAKANYADQSQVSSWARQSVKIGTYLKYVSGDGKNFSPKKSIIRADVAVVIYNIVK